MTSQQVVILQTHRDPDLRGRVGTLMEDDGREFPLISFNGMTVGIDRSEYRPLSSYDDLKVIDHSSARREAIKEVNDVYGFQCEAAMESILILMTESGASALTTDAIRRLRAIQQNMKDRILQLVEKSRSQSQ